MKRRDFIGGLGSAAAWRYVARAQAVRGLGEGTYTMMIEKNRLELFKAVQSFLDDVR